MGVSVVNQEHFFHFQPTVSPQLFEVSTKRHQQNINVDAGTTPCTESQWASIVASARSNASDSAFAAVVASVWSPWTADHLVTPGLVSAYRQFVLKIVDPTP